jgi:hypothetical protein
MAVASGFIVWAEQSPFKTNAAPIAKALDLTDDTM